MQFFCMPLLGALSDRFGRRPVLLFSIFGLGMNFLLTALAPSLWVLLIARVIGGATRASFSAANAYVADITSKEERSKSFGVLGAAFGLGFIVGPMAGGLLGAARKWPRLVRGGAGRCGSAGRLCSARRCSARSAICRRATGGSA